MRLTTVILIASLMQVSAATFGQRITMSYKNTSLSVILKEIRQQSGYDILYDGRAIAKDQKVSVNLTNADLDEALTTALKGLDLTYEVNEKNVTIKKKESTFLERVVATLADINVSGRVVDTDGRGLPGASVSVKGKKGKAVSTGTNGSFYLKGVDEDAVLLISFIGYVPKEVKAAKELGDVVLEISTSKLDEVQVIAYGTTTQRLSTGNVTTIKADVIEKQPVNNPLLALQGRVPGLFIEQATGFAGSGVKVRIQGQNSMNYGNDPLYVIDGIPFISQLLPGGNRIIGGSGARDNTSTIVIPGNPLSFINPSDIESIDILKDADATAIYGSRAANGAILITTKKGKIGDSKVNMNLQSGWAKVPRKLDLMNSQQYLEMRREALRNDGIAVSAPGPYGDSDLNGNWDTNRYTDWQRELIGGTATYQDFNASVSGGNERTTFLLGAGHHRETNVFPGKFADKKTSVRVQLSNSLANQKFKTEFSASYLFDNNELPNIDLTQNAMTLAPIAPAIYNSDGSINWAPDQSGTSTFFSNPAGYLFDNFLNKTANLLSNMVLSYQIVSGLEIKGVFGYNKLTSNIVSKRLLQSNPPENLQYSQRSTLFTNNEINSWSIEPQLTYNKDIGEGKLEILLGATIRKDRGFGSSVGALGFSNDLVMDDILSSTALLPLSSFNSTYKYNAAFGRLNYRWQDKYILNLTARRDGSSRFGPKSQFHNFAAIGGAWIFSNESLIKNHLALLSFGKLRASYGTTGSDQILDYQFLNLYDPLQQDVPYQGIIAYQPNRLTNPYLEWEETKKLQFGLDLGFLKDKILVSANYYRNRSSNQLNSYALPLTTGFVSITKNSTDKIKNSGWEITLTSTNFLTRDFKWSSNINFTLPKTLLSASQDDRFPYTRIVGEPLSAKYVFHFLGVNPATGVYQFEDRNGNTTSTPEDPLDKIVLIDLAPKFYGGIQNSLSYKGLQLDFLISFIKQIGQSPIFGINGAAGYGNFGNGNQLVSSLNRWQKPGDISAIQRLTTGNRLNQYLNRAKESDVAWTDASYIRLKNIAISWELPEKWIKTAYLQTCNLFVQGQNLWTFTNYEGLDPETKSSTTLPPLRVVTIGLKLGL